MQPLVLNVALFGKHPSSSEYIYFGHNSKFMNSIIHWVEEGYETLLQSRATKRSKEVYHFCFINKAENNFICSSIKMSKDSNNREYPLVAAIEISPCSFFKNNQEILEYSKLLNKKVLNIFKKEYHLEALKKELRMLSRYNKFETQEDSFVSSIFMNEDFSEVKLFSRPLEKSDFTKLIG